MVAKQVSKDDDGAVETVQNVLGIERKFLGWLVGICSTLAVGGTITIGSILWNLNSSVVALTTSMTNFQLVLNGLQSQVAAQGVDRYSANDASKDRALFEAKFNMVNEKMAGLERDTKALAIFDAEVKQFMREKHP